MSDDDLARWHNDPLVRALRAPGSLEELAHQERYVAAYRGSRRGSTTRHLRSVGRRLGRGGTTALVLVALGSGAAAAAYTERLPAPVQRVVHDVLGPLGVGAPKQPVPEADREPAGSSTDGPGPQPGGLPTSPGASAPTQSTGESSGESTGEPTDQPTTGPTQAPSDDQDGPSTGTQTSSPDDEPSDGDESATDHPSDDPSDDPTDDPTTTVPPQPVRMTIAGSAHRVAPGGQVTLTTVVIDDDGAPVADRDVELLAKTHRQWKRVLGAATDADGVATFATPPATRSVVYRVRADRGVRSDRWRVVLQPTLAASSSVTGRTAAITGTAVGARGGDSVRLLRRTGHGPTQVREGRLDDTGTVRFQVRTPRQRAVYVLRLLHTPAHAAARATIRVVHPRPASVSATVGSSRVVVGRDVVVSGTVRTADGSALPDRAVRLVAHVAGVKGWSLVARGTTAADGSTSLTLHSLQRTTKLRLVSGRVSSARVRVVMVPVVSARVTVSGRSATIEVTARGTVAGDTAVLKRRKGGRLVVVDTAPLTAAGTTSFDVPVRHRRVVYVLHLRATSRHGAAATKVAVGPA